MNVQSKKFLTALIRKSNLSECVRQINTYSVISELEKDNIEVELVLKEVVKIMKRKKIKIPALGYLDLISFVE